jgi:outer membrane protein TolC
MSRLFIAFMLVLALGAPALAQQPLRLTRTTALPSGQQPANPQPAGRQSANQQPSGPTLSLSMDEAVTMALETNLGLKADRLGVGVAAENVANARSAFRPHLQGSFNNNASDQPPANFTDLSATLISAGSQTVTSTFFQNVNFYGGSYSATWAGSRSTTTANLATFNPRTTSSVVLTYQQPLIRNFLIDNNRFTLQSAERQRQIADLTLEGQIAATRDAVQRAYLNLVASIEGLNVAQQNMDLAQENLRNFRARVAVGVSADIDVIQAEAEVASNEEQVIVAESAIGTSEDALRSLIVDPARPDFWQLHLKPTDTVVAVPRQIDVDAAIGNALANRLDLIAARRQQDITRLGLKLDENMTKPDVSFSLNYTAQATGGTQFIYGQGTFPPPLISQTNRSFSSVLDDAFGAAYPSWTAGVTFNYPLGLSSAKATLARDRLQKEQEDLNVKNLEMQVAASVRNAARDVQTNYKRVEATQKARSATERQLDAEQRKFGVGLSTSFELQSRQRDLAQSRINELNAIIDYNRSLIAFERVQKIQ